MMWNARAGRSTHACGCFGGGRGRRRRGGCVWCIFGWCAVPVCMPGCMITPIACLRVSECHDHLHDCCVHTSIARVRLGVLALGPASTMDSHPSHPSPLACLHGPAPIPRARHPLFMQHEHILLLSRVSTLCCVVFVVPSLSLSLPSQHPCNRARTALTANPTSTANTTTRWRWIVPL
jgi:hypothetical protein